jgi:hypothetical protein
MVEKRMGSKISQIWMCYFDKWEMGGLGKTWEHQWSKKDPEALASQVSHTMSPKNSLTGKI